MTGVAAGDDLESFPLDELHARCAEMLKSGETYPKAYRAAFRYPTRERFPQVAVPALVCSTAADPLTASSVEAATLSPRARWQPLPDDPAGQAALIDSSLREGA